MTDVDVDPTDRTPLIPHTDDGDDDDTPQNPFPTGGSSRRNKGVKVIP